MRRRVLLTRVRLAYASGMVLHTASSGAVPVLDELRLTARDGGRLAAIGATRVNIEYLSGLPPDDIVARCAAVAAALDWGLRWDRLIDSLDCAFPALPAPARMLFEMAAADGQARLASVPLAAHLGGDAGAAGRIATNQTLFHAARETVMARAEAYVARGFLDLKLRVGLEPLAEDLARLSLLRQRFGAHLRLSADANGRWCAERLLAVRSRLAALDLAYLEQPLAAGDWEGTARLSAIGPAALMLDESLADQAAIERLIASRAAAFAHLKLAKLGGLDRLLRAGRRLKGAGFRVMVGQMNEGSVSTLAAAHAAVALEADLAELYGADGLAGDPAGALCYAQGWLYLPPGPGLGITEIEDTGEIIWEGTA